MEIIENFVPQIFQDELENVFSSPFFPWFFNKSTLYVDGKLNGDRSNFPQTEQVIDGNLFTHLFVEDNRQNSDFCNLIKPLIDAMPFEYKSIARIKANWTTQQPGNVDGMHSPVHVDFDIPNLKTAVYYVNDSDGDTVLFNERVGTDTPLTIKSKVTPKKGTLLIFDGSLLHAAEFPQTSKYRMVINLNFVPI